MSDLFWEGRARPRDSDADGAEDIKLERVDVKFRDEVEDVVMSLFFFRRGTL